MTRIRAAGRALRASVLGWVARLGGSKAGAVIVYHRVGGAGGDESLEILPAVSTEELDRQLRHLRRRYRVVQASGIVAAARQRRRGGRFPVAITFDDDLRSHVDHALPALRRHGLTATFFLTGTSLEAPHAFWWEDLQRAVDRGALPAGGLPHVDERVVRAAAERAPRAILDLAGAVVGLAPEERSDVVGALRTVAGAPPVDSGLRTRDVRELVDAGCAIGFHTAGHEPLPTLSDEALGDALRDGRDALSAVTGAELAVLAYPHGKSDRRVADAARDAGFVHGFTTGRGLVAPDVDPLLIPRTVADLSADALGVRLARAFATRRGTPGGVVSSPPPSSERMGVPRDPETIDRENERLRKEVRRLRERVAAYESSRWWRLHPRTALGRLGRGGVNEDAATAEPEADAAHLPVDFDEIDAQLCRRVGPYTMTTPPRIYALARAVEYVVARRVPGALVECGVWRGGSMMAVALTLLRLGVTDRELYLFDTFSGMTEPGEEDVRHSGETAADRLAVASKDEDVWAIASLEDVREAVLGVGYPAERIHFVEGPVEETVPGRAPEQIALLRLDTDWYASTKHELEHLYPRLEPGGVLILDDYGYWQGARQAVDEYVSEKELSLLLNRIDHTGRIALKP